MYIYMYSLLLGRVWGVNSFGRLTHRASSSTDTDDWEQCSRTPSSSCGSSKDLPLRLSSQSDCRPVRKEQGRCCTGWTGSGLWSQLSPEDWLFLPTTTTTEKQSLSWLWLQLHPAESHLLLLSSIAASNRYKPRNDRVSMFGYFAYF